MKHIKTIGFAAVVAMASMALVGAGSASATVLCKTNLTSGCAAAGQDYAAGTHFHATLEGGTETFEVGTTVLDTCTGSTFTGHTENTGGASDTVSIQETSVVYEGCTRTTNLLELGTLEIHHIAGTDNGTVTINKFKVTIATIFGSCIYGYNSTYQHIGEIIGGSPATLKTTTEIPKISGPCPGTSAKWTAADIITSPTPLFVAAS